MVQRLNVDRRYYVDESSRDRIIRHSDRTEIQSNRISGESYSASDGMPTETVKIIAGSYTVSGVTYYYGRVLISWPEDNYLEEITETVYVRFFNGFVPTVGDIFQASKAGFTWDINQRAVDVYNVSVGSTGSTYTDEMAQDAIAAIAQDSATINFIYNDAANTMQWLVLLSGFSVVATATGLELENDLFAPGNSKYYGTNATGVRGWYALPSGTYTDEQAQDAVAIMLADTNTIDFTYNDASNTMNFSVKHQFSIDSNSLGIKFVGDSAAPGNSKYYGTNATGVRGWYDLGSSTYTDEMAQDAIGLALISSFSIQPSYNDAANQISFSAKVQGSLEIPDNLGIRLVNDSGNPGANMYYGTDGTGIKGWLSGTGGYTNEMAQDAVAAALIDTQSINVTYNDLANTISLDAIVNHSISIGALGIVLFNDVGSPGGFQYYGTDSGGIKGWHSFLESLQDLLVLNSTDTNSIEVIYDDVLDDIQWRVKSVYSLAQDGAGLHFLNDVDAPGNLYYYGTNEDGVKGWYLLANVGYNDELAQDAIGNAMVSSQTIQVGYFDDTNQFIWHVYCTGSIVSGVGGIQLASDNNAPGFSKYYGTNVAGAKGWYDLPTGGYSDEMARDAIGAASIDTNSINVTYDDAADNLKWELRFQHSITVDVNGAKLIGDSASPGANKYYGTDAGGTKGFYNLPSPSSSAAVDIGVNQCRISVSSASYPESPESNSAYVWLVPHTGGNIGVWNSGVATMLTLGSSLPYVTSLGGNTVYDIYVYDAGGGNPALEAVAWSSGSSRATGVVYSGNIPTKATDNQRRYVGTVETDSFGYIYDTPGRRKCWNFNNQVLKQLQAWPIEDSHTYTTATYRPWGNDSTVGQTRVEFVVGFKSAIYAIGYGNVYNPNEPWMSLGIGFDSTTTNAARGVGGFRMQMSAILADVCLAGKHYMQLLERSNVNGTTTWYGDAGFTESVQTSLQGWLEC